MRQSTEGEPASGASDSKTLVMAEGPEREGGEEALRGFWRVARLIEGRLGFRRNVPLVAAQRAAERDGNDETSVHCQNAARFTVGQTPPAPTISGGMVIGGREMT
jgi:hypothetical protein